MPTDGDLSDGVLAEGELQEVIDDNTRRSIDALAGNPNFEQIKLFISAMMEGVNEQLVTSRDPVDIHRAQGGLIELRDLLKVLSP